MVTAWSIFYTKQALKDATLIKQSNLKQKVQALLELMKQDPFVNPPPYKKLVGNLSGAISRRINIQHRMVYQVIESEHAIKILRMWTHYE